MCCAGMPLGQHLVIAAVMQALRSHLSTFCLSVDPLNACPAFSAASVSEAAPSLYDFSDGPDPQSRRTRVMRPSYPWSSQFLFDLAKAWALERCVDSSTHSADHWGSRVA